MVFFLNVNHLLHILEKKRRVPGLSPEAAFSFNLILITIVTFHFEKFNKISHMLPSPMMLFCVAGRWKNPYIFPVEGERWDKSRRAPPSSLRGWWKSSIFTSFPAAGLGRRNPLSVSGRYRQKCFCLLSG